MSLQTYGSLFAGVGGIDIGLDSAGMNCLFQVEIDENCLQTLEYHWPNSTKMKNITNVCGHDLPEVDIIAFGSPCQDLSAVGRRAGLNGKKSSLFHEAIRIIKEMREKTNGQYPKWTIWENVVGALYSNSGDDFGQVLSEMDDAGACFSEWAVLDAQYFGVPQRRRRIYLLSVFDTAIAARCPSKILPVGESNPRNGKENGYFTFYTSQGKYDSYTEGIATTLKTAGNICITNKNIAPRKLTPIECERLMGWPDNHTLYRADGKENSDSTRYKMCGNGVASPVIKWIAEQLLKI